MERRPHLGPLFLTFFFVSIYLNDGWIYGKIRKLKENLDTFPKNITEIIMILWDTYSVDNKRVCIDQDVIDGPHCIC